MTISETLLRLRWAKWLSAAVSVLMVCLLATSCDEEAIDVEEVNKQTIFVYMPWSGSNNDSGLYECFLANLDSIEAAIINKGGLDKSRLVVFLSESATSSKLYEVRYDKNQGLSHKELKNYSGHDYTTVEGLTRIFNDVQGAAYALNYALIAGGHGTGWTVCVCVCACVCVCVCVVYEIYVRIICIFTPSFHDVLLVFLTSLLIFFTIEIDERLHETKRGQKIRVDKQLFFVVVAAIDEEPHAEVPQQPAQLLIAEAAECRPLVGMNHQDLRFVHSQGRYF